MSNIKPGVFIVWPLINVTEFQLTLKNPKTSGTFFLEARAYNNGISFRFIVPGNHCLRTPDEATVFKLPANSTVWYHDLYSHYEGIYVKKEPDKNLFPDGINTAWIKPGRAVWTWLDGGDRTPEGMKEYSRMAGELDFEYNVVDAFWYRWTDEQISDLVSYSKERGVGVWLWRHGRDVKDPVKRRDFFKRCHDLGIVGVKLDAFSNESKEFIDLPKKKPGTMHLSVCDRLLDPAAVKREKAFTRNTDTFPVRMSAGGGYIARFTK